MCVTELTVSESATSSAGKSANLRTVTPHRFLRSELFVSDPVQVKALEAAAAARQVEEARAQERAARQQRQKEQHAAAAAAGGRPDTAKGEPGVECPAFSD